MTGQEKSKMALSIGLLLVLMLSFFSTGSACTSFAVYSTHKIYGMNLDYANVELKFNIIRNGNRKIFQAFFIENGGSYTFCGVNSSGVFSSIQMLYPQLTSWPAPGPNQIDLGQAFTMFTTQCDSLQQGYDYLNSTGVKVIHISGSTFHDFFADSRRTACVLEVGTDSNYITKMKGDYLVMTNFPNHLYADTPPENVSGAGADRYKTACQYIEAHKSDFVYDDAIEVLQRTAQTSGSFPTQCSCVFDPENNEVYLILRQVFTRIWKVSIDNETIETHSGFNRFTRMPLGSSGLTSSDLITLSGATQVSHDSPSGFVVNQNYPNPFNPSTTIKYQLARNARVRLRVFNILGTEVATPLDEWQSAGPHEFRFTAENLVSGVYFYQLTAGSFKATRKCVLIR
jgi:hypothetical protein